MNTVLISRYKLLKLGLSYRLTHNLSNKKNVKVIYKNDLLPRSKKIKFMPALSKKPLKSEDQNQKIKVVSKSKMAKENQEDQLIPKNDVANLKSPKIEMQLQMPDKIKMAPKSNMAEEAQAIEQRKNEVGMQMLSKNLHQQVFKNVKRPEIHSEVIHSCLNELDKFGLHNNDGVTQNLDDVILNLPPLTGRNLEEHFQILGEEQSGPYRQLVLDLLEGIPKAPEKWQMKPGWVRYAPNTKPEKISHPLEDALVFDVEICLSAGKIPTMATAVSKEAWYGWVSKALVDEVSKPITEHHFKTKDLIPLEENLGKERHLSPNFNKPRIVVGHNVSFDRARVKEQYLFEKSELRFLDTMSLHICVSGITSYQRALLRSKDPEQSPEDDNWKTKSSLNSLSEVHKLYCGSEVEKSARDIFVEGSLPEIKKDFQNLMNYCANDVLATYRVVKELFPMFLERFPHPVTLAGMLELGMAYLPVNSNWTRYINDCEQTYQDLNTEAKFLLTRRADQACQLLHNENYKEDIWLWDQDWSTQNIKLKKTLKKSTKKTKTESQKNTSSTQNGTLGPEESSSVSQNAPFSTVGSQNTIVGPKNENIVPNNISEPQFSNLDHQKRFLGSFESRFSTLETSRTQKDSAGHQNYTMDRPKELKSQLNEAESTQAPEFLSPQNLQGSQEDRIFEIDSLETKFEYLEMTKGLLPARIPFLPGYPAWYRKVCSKMDASNHETWVPGPILISTSMQITPKLLNLTWEGYPLHYVREKGWGFLVPHSEDAEFKKVPLKKILEKCPLLVEKDGENFELIIGNFEKELERNLNQKEWWRKKPSKRKEKISHLYHGSGVWTNLDLEECCYFFKLPHKDGPSNNVGNPLSRDFLNKFSENVLASDSSNAEKVLQIARMCSYWRNNRDRIREQMVVWLRNSETPTIQNDGQFGSILPLVVVSGTLTRRAMEPTWMTASNAQKERIGSELRSIVQAPPGYSIVGADVDSQELWIASLLGDTYSKIHGGTPLGHMTLIGTKSSGTDMHSVTAKAVGISRDHAKVINYARIYGAGQSFAERLLKQFNPQMGDGEAKKKAQKMFNLTKGKRLYRLKKEFSDTFEPKLYSTFQAFEIAKTYGKTLDEVFHKSRWIGGSESAMFNRLEEIANLPKPQTPFLGARLSRSLETDTDRFLPTKINWVVQSGAVDFLHLILVSMKYLMKDQIRFCLSFHDEVRYIVPDHLKYDTALAMHITNLLVRSFCSLKVGINDLPMSIAFFSSVEVDTVLRKDSHLDCKTPSNPHGLEKGYKIKNGESLTVQEVIGKTGGRLSLWEDSSSSTE